ncbi:MAG: L-lysine 6-transaminase [Acidobacteria bacterium]|nr:L-lysine 6-transaminase [Acidobacteriota bacterium]
MEKSRLRIGATQVQPLMADYMPIDGLGIVVDFEKSHGAHLYDAKTDQFYLDFLSFYASNPLGFNHPRLTSPEVVEELGRVAIHKPSNSDIYSREMAEFLDVFVRHAKPDFMKYTFFIEGGALAVENALKTAFDWKVRKNLARGSKKERGHKVIHFQEAFHGRSGYTLSLTNTSDVRKTQYFPKFDWPRIVNPKCSFPLEGENLQQVKKLEERALAQIQTVLVKDSEDICALILEPIQGEGGDNHFRPAFHVELRRICDENDILLIYDEVQTGFGATGRMWAFEHYVRPDILAFGKKFQVCGILASDRVDEVGDNVFHVPSRINSTWGGNLIDMVRCRLYLEIFEEEKVLQHTRRMGEVLLAELRQLEEEFPSKVTNSRGIGLFCAFDLPDTEFRTQFRQKLFENRLLMLPAGEHSIRFRTALNISEEDLLEGLRIIREVLHEM